MATLPPPAALAIDLGTTAVKAAVVGTDGRIHGTGHATLTTISTPDGGFEQDAEAIWQAVLAASREALTDAGPNAAAVRVVAPTSQWASVVPVDAAGLPVGPLMLWLDRRGDAETDALFAGPYADDCFLLWPDVHGFIPTASLGHLLFFQHQRPEIHARAVKYLEPADYLAARFSGRLAASANSAMPFTLTDNRVLGEVSWSNDLIERAGVDAGRLPELVGSLQPLATIRADVADALGLDRDVTVAVGANDSIAAAFGTGALEPGRGTVVMGTTGVFTAHHLERVIALDRFVLTMPSALTDRRYVMAEAGLGGKVLEWFLEQVLLGNDELSGPRPADPYAALFRMARSVEAGAGDVGFVPWLNGSIAPAPNFAVRGSFIGLTSTTTRAQLVRAVLEGISLQMRWLVDEVETAIGTTYATIRFTGGGARSDVWAQLMADVLGRTVEQLEDPLHANARGAGFMGLVSIGALGLGDLEALVPLRATYAPDTSLAELYATRLGLHRDLHATLTEPSMRLARRGS